MFTYQIKAGTTDVSVVIRIIDSTDGTPETGVVFNTSGLDLEYRREGATSTDITEADLSTPALDDAHADGGFLHIGNGYYRLDLPDAACAASATGVLVHGTCTGMVVIGCYIQLVAYDPFDTVRLGLTALPNAAADAAGGLPISDAGALDLDALDSQIDAIETDTQAIETDTQDIQNRLPAALVGGRISADAVAVSGSTTAADNVEANIGNLDAPVSTVDTVVDAIQAVTDNLPDSGALTSLAQAAKLLAYVQLLARSDAAIATDLSTELGEINANEGSGAGDYANQTEALEAVRDHVGDGTNLTEAGGDGDHLNAVAIGTGGIASTAFASGAIDAAALNADAVDEILDEQIGDSTVTVRQALKLMVSALGGKLSGAATTSIAIRNVADDTDVISATVDANGNRSAVTLSL